MIKLTGNNIMTITPVLRELVNKPFKGSISFKLMRLMKKIDEESKTLEGVRNNLLKKYGKKNQDGILTIQEDKIEECNKELEELINTEIEINAEKIPVSAFEKIEITPAQALAIETIIDFE